MANRNVYKIVKSRHVTEKARVLEQLQHNTNNRCIAKFDKPKYVFIVEKKATKHQIAQAIEEIYAEKKVKVKSVNTISMKPKQRRVRGKLGFRPGFKKAIITFEAGDMIDDEV